MKFVASLLKQLEKEKALYTKIEIATCLEKGNKNTCRAMIDYLGKIGKNQYKQVPNKVSRKISYPLPRDLIARIIGKMDPSNFEVLLASINTVNEHQLAELIDAIGFMVFYHPQLATIYHFNCIKAVMLKHKNNELIVWKSVICLSAFKLKDNIQFLEQLYELINNKKIALEIKRSLNLIKQNN